MVLKFFWGLGIEIWVECVDGFFNFFFIFGGICFQNGELYKYVIILGFYIFRGDFGEVWGVGGIVFEYVYFF